MASGLVSLLPKGMRTVYDRAEVYLIIGMKKQQSSTWFIAKSSYGKPVPVSNRSSSPTSNSSSHASIAAKSNSSTGPEISKSITRTSRGRRDQLFGQGCGVADGSQRGRVRSPAR